MTGNVLLGRCVQGLKFSTDPSTLDALAELLVEVVDCSNNPGPTITVSGSTEFEQGLVGRFTFQNNLKGTHAKSVTVDVELLPQGQLFQIPKQPPLGGVGGNPLIWVETFLSDAFGNVTWSDSPIFLGRCNQIP